MDESVLCLGNLICICISFLKLWNFVYGVEVDVGCIRSGLGEWWMESINDGGLVYGIMFI